MAESKETVIFEIDVSRYEKSLADLTKSIGGLKTQQKQFQEQTKQGIAGAAEAYEKVTAQLKIQQQQYRTTQNVLVGYTAAQSNAVDTSNFLNNSIQQNRDLLKQLTAQYINTRNPQEQFTKKIKDLSDALKQQEAAMGDTRRNVGNYAEGFKTALTNVINATPALKGFQTAQLGVNAAMNANPIGAIIMLFTGLVEILKNNAEVADQVTFAIDGLTKGFNFIIDAIVNTVSSLDNLTNALRHPIDFITNLAKGTANAAKEGYNASKALDAFELSAGRYDRAIQKNQINIDALTKSLKDRTKGEQERIKIANQIADLEIKNADLIIKKNQELLNAETLRLKGKSLTAAEQNKLEQLQTDVQNAEAEKRIVNAQRQTRINILLDKQVTESKKSETKTRAEIEREREEQIKKTFDNERTIRAAEIELIKDGLQKKLLLFDLAFEKEEQALREAGATEVLITELRNARIAEITANFYKSQTEQTEGFIENRKALLEQAERDLIASADRAALELGIRQTAQLAGILGDFASVFGQAANLVTQFAEQNVAALQDQYEKGIINEEQFNAQSKDLKIKAFKDAKALKITEAIITTATSTLNAFNSGLQLGGPFGLILGAVFAAAAAGIGAAQIALISRQQPPKYAEGGSVFDVGGKPHSQGGTLYTGTDGNRFEVERGEKIFVLKKSASEHINMLGGLNMAFGGNSWNGSPTKYAAEGGQIGTGGFVTRDINNNAEQGAIMRASIIEGFKRAPQPVVSVKEINAVNKGLQRSVAVSEL